MEYTVKYSKRKTVALTLKDGSLTVRAPFGTTKSTISSLIEKHKDWINKQLTKMPLNSKMSQELSKEETERLRALAREALSAKTKYYADIMGIKYGKVRITSAKTRFGSYSARGDISYSLRLMLYPEEAIDYVVVHEVAHIKEMNHSKNFYAIIEKVMPDYKLRKRMLKD
jgi:predicted metal-dependent hydrolase